MPAFETSIFCSSANYVVRRQGPPDSLQVELANWLITKRYVRAGPFSSVCAPVDHGEDIDNGLATFTREAYATCHHRQRSSRRPVAERPIALPPDGLRS